MRADRGTAIGAAHRNGYRTVLAIPEGATPSLRRRDLNERLAEYLPAIADGGLTDSEIEQLELLPTLVEPKLGSASLDDRLRELLTCICAILSADTGAILLVDGDGAALTPCVVTGIGATAWHEKTVAIGSDFAGQVAAQRRPIFAHRAAAEAPPAAHQRRIRSLLGVPIMAGTELIGVVHVGSCRVRSFTAVDARALQFAAARMALSVAHARLLATERDARIRAERAQQRMSFLIEASAILGRSLDYTTALQDVARLAVSAFADCCAIEVFGGDGSSRLLAAAANDPAKDALLAEISQQYLAGPVWTAREILIPEVAPSLWMRVARDEGHRELLERLGLRSIIAVPIVVHERNAGTLCFGAVEHRFSTEDLALAQELARRAAAAIANAQLYEEARNALRVRDELLATITHDLAQPLTSIRTLAYVLQDSESQNEPTDTLWLAGRLDKTATKMTAFCRELLDLARLEAGQPLDLHRRPTDLVELAGQLAEQHAQEGQSIRVEAPVSELVGMWDKFRLERVINNLLSNAVKYSPDGGEIVMRLTQEQAGATGPDWAVLSVEDQGLGIPAADLPQLFSPFHRGRNVVGKFKGTGLGLAGSRQIVEQHGGTITAASEEGRGSTFTVRLPLD